MIPRTKALEMMKKYEAEQQELREQLTVAHEELESYDDKYSELEVFTKAIAEIRVGVKEKINGEKV